MMALNYKDNLHSLVISNQMPSLVAVAGFIQQQLKQGNVRFAVVCWRPLRSEKVMSSACLSVVRQGNRTCERSSLASPNITLIKKKLAVMVIKCSKALPSWGYYLRVIANVTFFEDHVSAMWTGWKVFLCVSTQQLWFSASGCCNSQQVW